MYSADLFDIYRISVTRQFLVSLTSIVYFFPTMEVNETRNCLFTDILLYQKNRLNTFENRKTQLFKSGGVVK